MIAGRYSLDREIGRGGMGAVWLAWDEVLHRRVAIKRVGATPDGSDPDLTRAEREARLAASLNHPHVVGVFDLVHEDDRRWLVMEYVEGESLAALVRRGGALAPDRAAALLRQAAEALAAAHSAGIVHRDVKPSNMMVTPRDQVKLTDFGIARATADATLTQTGLVTGSPAYLAPEVATGRPATDRSDVWSLGATLFHALAGRPPYDVGDNVMGALYRIVHEDPPRLTQAGWLSPVLEATMATEPDHRWSMAEVARFLADGPTAAPAAQDRTRALGAAVPPSAAAAADKDASGAVSQSEATRAEATAAGSGGGASRGGRGPSRLLIGLLALAVVVLLALGIWTTWPSSEEPDPAGSGSPSTASPTASPTESGSASQEPTPTPSATEDGTAEEAEAMEGFAENYLATVTSEPRTTWEQLTPAFQEQSGGFAGYSSYWSTIAEVEVLDISADPEAGTVTYSVEYTRQNGSTVTDVVTLELRESGDSYLIAGES